MDRKNVQEHKFISCICCQLCFENGSPIAPCIHAWITVYRWANLHRKIHTRTRAYTNTLTRTFLDWHNCVTV